MHEVKGGRLTSAIMDLRLAPFLWLVAGSRLLLLAVLWFVTHGRELSNDVAMHMQMIRSPLSVLLYTDPSLEQHPPFLPLLEAVFAYPLQLVLPAFLAIRLLMIVYEVLLAFLFYRLVERLNLSARRRAFCFFAFVALPTGWMTSTVMAQDDCIGACTFLLPLLLSLAGRQTWALVLGGVGFLAGKLFVVLDVFVLSSFSTKGSGYRDWLRNAAIGLSPILLVYGGMTASRLLHSEPVPLFGFHPDIYFGTNFWMVLRRTYGLNLARLGVYSGILALAASLIPTFILLKSIGTRSAQDLLVAAGSSLLLFYSFFYHVEPEYFTIVMPALLLTTENALEASGLVFLSLLLWAGKFFQNAAFMYRTDNSPGKAVARAVFDKLLHASPLALLTSDQLIVSALTIVLSVVWVRKLLKAPRTTSLPAIP